MKRTEHTDKNWKFPFISYSPEKIFESSSFSPFSSSTKKPRFPMLYPKTGISYFVAYFDSNYATEAEPLSDGSTIYGRVATELGEPIVGCVVSDGKQCVQTDQNGHYALKSDMNSTRFVFISIPADYEIEYLHQLEALLENL